MLTGISNFPRNYVFLKCNQFEIYNICNCTYRKKAFSGFFGGCAGSVACGEVFCII